MPKRNIAMYPVEEELLNRAIESPNGITIKHKDKSKDFHNWSIHTRQRLNQCREADRQRNSTLYPDTDPRWGKSPFDGLLISIDKELQAITITPRMEDLNELEIEEID